MITRNTQGGRHGSGQSPVHRVVAQLGLELIASLFGKVLVQIDRLVRQPGQAGQRLVPDLAAVAVGAPQVPRFVVVPLSLLVHVAAADPGHVHRRRLLAHTRIIWGNVRRARYDTPFILATSRRPDQALSPGQPAIPTQSYGNFGLTGQWVTDLG